MTVSARRAMLPRCQALFSAVAPKSLLGGLLVVASLSAIAQTKPGSAAPARSSAVAVAAAQISAARIWPSEDYTRVAIEATQRVEHAFFSLKNPERLVLDLYTSLDSVALSELPSKVSATEPHVRSVRVARNRPGVVRIVFDLKTSVEANVFPVRPIAGYGHRLVIDIVPTRPADPLMALINQNDQPGSAGADPGSPAAEAASSSGALGVASNNAASAAAPATNARATPKPAEKLPAVASTNPAAAGANAASAGVSSVGAPLTSASASENASAIGSGVEMAAASTPERAEAATKNAVDRMLTVAVDAGHGGEDPGAHGRAGTREKHVTLAIARQIKAELERDGSTRVVLTRDGDYFVPLAMRVHKARRARADLFVSVHADAFVRPDARGSSVFALSPRGASSAAARWLAQRENEADSIGGINVKSRNPYLARTLLELAQTSTIDDSLRLGRIVLSEIGGLNRLHKPRVEQAGFAVLKAPDIPSILVETAFISNPAEERRLADGAYQAKMARVIADGIRKYLAAHPPLSRAKLAVN